MLVDQALLWAAIVPMGGGQSLFALLLPAGVALAWQLEGKAAARFYAVLSLAGLAALIVLGALPLTVPGAFPLLLIALAAPALLVALEAASGHGAAEPAALPAARPETIPREIPAVRSEAPAPSPERRREEAILHDLKSPLSVLRVYADLISEGAKRGELPNPEHLTNLSREIDLAEKLLGASAPARPAAERGGAPEPVAAPSPEASADLVEILGSLATAYRLSLGGRRRVEFIAEKPELTVAADPVALQRAFRNVIENAVKYTPEGGEIRIRAGPAGPHAFVVFKDTGIGMTPEERTHAFDYAFRGVGRHRHGRARQGHRPRRDEGDPRGQRRPDQPLLGSRLRLRGHDPAPLLAGRAVRRIVVVDDEPGVGAAIRDLLSTDGYAVEAPGDARTALPELIRAVPDLVILDVNMPGMSGWELCAILRRQTNTRGVPILFLTGRQELKDRITAMQLGGSDFLAKPFGADELRRKVRAVFEREPDETTEER